MENVLSGTWRFHKRPFAVTLTIKLRKMQVNAALVRVCLFHDMDSFIAGALLRF